MSTRRSGEDGRPGSGGRIGGKKPLLLISGASTATESLRVGSDTKPPERALAVTGLADGYRHLLDRAAVVLPSGDFEDLVKTLTLNLKVFERIVHDVSFLRPKDPEAERPHNLHPVKD